MKVHFLLKNTGMFERLGIMTLSSVLKKEGHKVKLSLTEELKELKELYEDGSLTKEQFEKAKNKLLN